MMVVKEKNISPMETTYIPISPDMPVLKAALESIPPSRVEVSSSPDVIMTSPVIVQIMMVVKKTPVMAIRPCRTPELDLAAATTIGALPSPASLVYTPRAIPVRIAVITETITVPVAPPATAEGSNADFTIRANASGSAEA